MAARVPARTRSSRPWSWNQVRKRTLAVYECELEGRSLVAVLIWQGDDDQVAIDGECSRLVAFTLNLDPEPDEENMVRLAGFDSLEEARAHCVEWTGGVREVGWDALSETAQIGVYASIREPGFANVS